LLAQGTGSGEIFTGAQEVLKVRDAFINGGVARTAYTGVYRCVHLGALGQSQRVKLIAVRSWCRGVNEGTIRCMEETSVPVSQLIQRPEITMAQAHDGDVLITRLSGQDLVLTTLERLLARNEISLLLGYLVIGATNQEDWNLTKALTTELSWMRWLNITEVNVALEQLIASLERGLKAGDLAGFTETVAHWRVRAGLFSDHSTDLELVELWRDGEY
jgi:hypothetical protein